MTCHLRQQTTRRLETQNSVIVVAEKTRCFIFSPKISFSTHCFYSKYLENTIKTLLNQYLATKKPQTAPKPEIHLKQKFFPSSDMLFYVFSR
jgi:hypothetical protein